ncbi:hypothetical protein QTA58_22600 [Neorhizobium sp. CSC1952]|uniref:hypothetical protein n=1 Tax=Neorhizobium sp. CSC1952 TaxID=2978974 RepID=UPI0025A538F5|nr:hypothetical protein [Rhizobium sp. CSC1952]WJR66945.1 hypothetical protein QTA58_22600 [Rhizobium sp. CSC1952]
MPEAFFTFSATRPRNDLIPHLADHKLQYPGNAVVGFRDGYAKVTVEQLDVPKLVAAKIAW